MPQPRFLIRRSTDNQYYFNLHAANAEKILTSERYTSRASAISGVESVKVNAPVERLYDRLTSSSGDHFFTLRSANGQVLGTSEMYSSRAARDGGIEAVKRDAPIAEVLDG